jgi:hypothetical protein
MLKINQFSQLATLPITPLLIEQIQNHLLEPFDNQQQAEALWSELNCQLWLLTAEDEQAQLIRPPILNGF